MLCLVPKFSKWLKEHSVRLCFHVFCFSSFSDPGYRVNWDFFPDVELMLHFLDSLVFNLSDI